MIEKLTQKQRDELKSRHKKSVINRICDRIKAVLAYDKDLRYREVSEILLLDEEAIRRYIKDYIKQSFLEPKH